MILSILALAAKVLPNIVLRWMQTKNDAAKIAADEEIGRRTLQQQVLIKEADHWIAWLPRFVIAMSCALYTAQVMISSMIQRPDLGPLKMPEDFIYILLTVVGALFLDKMTKRFRS